MKDIVLAYYKDRYEEQNNRFSSLETKGIIILRFDGIVLTAIGAAVKFSDTNIINPVGVDSWFRFFIFLLEIVFLLLSLAYAYRSFKIDKVPTLPKNDEALKYFKEQADKGNDDNIEKYLFDCYIKNIKNLVKFLDNKAVYLEYSYSMLL